MSARRKSGRGSLATPVRAEPEDAPEQGNVLEGLEDLRGKWVQERQAELDRVFDAHDTMVRSAVFVASVSNICQGSGGVPLGEICVSPFV